MTYRNKTAEDSANMQVKLATGYTLHLVAILAGYTDKIGPWLLITSLSDVALMVDMG